MSKLAQLLLCGVTLFAQSDTGELRVKVIDQAGLPVPCSVEIVSQSNQVRQTLETDAEGSLAAKRLPFGIYHVRVQRQGFAVSDSLVEIRSAIPKDYHVTLGVAPIETVLDVNDAGTLVDPHRTGAVNRIGADALADRITSQPGRSLLNLVDTQPGWLLEA